MGELDLFTHESPVGSEGVWGVADVTRRARQLVDSGFERIWVRGEVTGFKQYRSGHWYFTLRDRHAQIRCVMWRSDNERMRESPGDGLEVYVAARPTVWEERGEFRLTVKQMLPTTDDGAWHLQLERARAALERDGLLAPERKRPLPTYPARLAVVTSSDGAALRDILSILERRWPAMEVWVVPTRVQGEQAEREICAALEFANRLADVDVLIVGRGGGSREDLWAFNTEAVARAVAAMRMPTVSAVGHETDLSLTDLVADVRAATPSAAAETVAPSRTHIGESIHRLGRALARGLEGRVHFAKERVARSEDRLSAGVMTRLDGFRSRVDRLGAALDVLSPLKTLDRGFAVARDDDGRVLRSVRQFAGDMPFRLTVADGDVRATVRQEDA